MPRKTPEPELEDPGRIQTVSEFTRRIKQLLEGNVPACWVRGEVSNLRRQASGHCYFSLKDEGSQLTAVLFRGDAARQSAPLRDGQQVLAFGQVSVYEARGQYQLIVRVLLEDGLGRLQQKFEELKRKLAEEGLFDSERKPALPRMPAVVGFVTSPTGAAVRDFIRILQRRGWSGRLVILPVKVQGAGSAEEMADMLEFAQRLRKYVREPGAPEEHGEPFLAAGARPDVPGGEEQSPLFPVREEPFFDLLVIGRGGGSLEDLWAFNEERLVRAVAACRIPVISGVGHEIDTTLCDFAAARRAETPSAAAELISSGFLECRDQAAAAASSLHRLAVSCLERAVERVAHARSRLRLLSPRAVIEQHQLRLDDIGGRAAAALSKGLHARRHALAEAAGDFLRHAPEARLALCSARLHGLAKRLSGASPASVLHRGFAIVRDEAGKPVFRKKGIKADARLVNQFQDGEVRVRVEAAGEEAAPAPRRRSGKKGGAKTEDGSSGPSDGRG